MGTGRNLLILAAAALLAGCGNMSPLEPAPGQPLPVKPLMATNRPTPEELLTPPTYARPQRVDELIKRSEPRESSRFDLPPPDGGAVPLPIGGEKETSTEEVDPATPPE